MAPPEFFTRASLGVYDLTRHLANLRTWIFTINGVGAAYVCSLLIFSLSYALPLSPLLILPRLVSGLFALILLPGFIVGATILPKDLKNLGTSFILGLVLSILEIEALLNLTLAISLEVGLITWLCSMSSLVVLAGLMCLKHWNSSSSLESGLNWGVERQVKLIVLLALGIRVALFLLAHDSIAPDAAMYADYARSLVDGRFQSIILNEGATQDLWNGSQYIRHQGITYIFAVSWLLLPPTISGPTFLLVLIGSALILPIHYISKVLHGEGAGKLLALVLSIHPLFVFHSSVGYGPEIASLLLLVYGAIFLVKGLGDSKATVFLSGVLFGIVGEIWYPNFYIVCLSLSLLLLGFKILQLETFVPFTLSMLCVLLARLLFENPTYFLVSWLGAFGILYISSVWLRKSVLKNAIPLISGIFAVMTFWRWPLQVVSYAARSQAATTGLEQVSSAVLAPLTIELFADFTSFVIFHMTATTGLEQVSSAILAPLTIELFVSFVFFVIFHITPVLFCIIPFAVMIARDKRRSWSLLMVALIAAAGTLKTLSLISGSLQLIYIFSDSRYFLFITLVCIISLGAYFAKLVANDISERNSTSARLRITRKQRQCVLVFTLIVIGFVPSYLAMPSGLALINIEQRYAWSGLPSAVSEMGDDGTVFLVDRAREFSWLTGRISAVLKLSKMSLPYANASRELLSLAARFSADYLIADSYTLAHWRTLDFLLLESISLGTSVILGGQEIAEFYERSNIISAHALTLKAQTEPNEFGDYCRVFGFDTESFAKFRDVSILDSGWSTSNGGSITNVSGEVRLTIGNGHNSTNTWRPDGFDFDQMVNSGFLLLDLEEASAKVARIEVWDENGIILRYAENLGDGLHYCPLGEVTIGDIRIVIEGSSGESIIVRSISVWQVENP